MTGVTAVVGVPAPTELGRGWGACRAMHCVCRLFNMPIALAFSGGFIMSAISPTVLVTGMLELQRRKYGEEKSEPHLTHPLAAHL